MTIAPYNDINRDSNWSSSVWRTSSPATVYRTKETVVPSRNIINCSTMLRLRTVLALTVLSWAILAVKGAPHRGKSKNNDRPRIVYDQKQTGDFNLQVHLKDLQIIAIVGDEALGGDYDYAYDDSDFTIKPPHKPSTSTTTTSKPTTTSTTTTTTTSTTTAKPFTHIPVIITSTEDGVKDNAIKGLLTPNDTESDETTTQKITTSSSEPLISGETVAMAPGKIKVQILGSPSAAMGELSPPAGIIPGEDIQSDIGETVLHGEMASYRKCATGYSRDKKGRCRRVRKPVTSNLFGRLTSNLASKLKLSTPEDRSVP
ncbi:uncharacterized protein LOC115884785 [Sitophilus oryzae]|uniref:Uncharacterized protein LOC115884785 n=1 Tax=Sitophilus oryzae TaxID=7048 RepID=A0A6J2Y866_SITOR|nr:uncharacterized protein LOC115884785 [Sitophilus oryzae]